MQIQILMGLRVNNDVLLEIIHKSIIELEIYSNFFCILV